MKIPVTPPPPHEHLSHLVVNRPIPQIVPDRHDHSGLQVVHQSPPHHLASTASRAPPSTPPLHHPIPTSRPAQLSLWQSSAGRPTPPIKPVQHYYEHPHYPEPSQDLPAVPEKPIQYRPEMMVRQPPPTDWNATPEGRNLVMARILERMPPPKEEGNHFTHIL